MGMPADDLDPALATELETTTSAPDPLSVDLDAAFVAPHPYGVGTPAPPPVRERDDELLPNPPMGQHGGRLAGYAAGSGMRRLLFALVVVFVAGGVALLVWYTRTREPVHAQQFQLPEGSEMSARPRTMVWSGGQARLGLDRAPPGLLAIELPDRTLRLAEGCDQAQFKVDVEDGRTKTLKVLFGEVTEELGPGARPKLKAAE